MATVFMDITIILLPYSNLLIQLEVIVKTLCLQYLSIFMLLFVTHALLANI